MVVGQQAERASALALAGIEHHGAGFGDAEQAAGHGAAHRVEFGVAEAGVEDRFG